MKFNHFACTAFLFLSIVLGGMARTAGAQSAAPTGTSGVAATTPGAVATIDVSRLPIDLQRIERRFRQNQTREERSGLNLRYFIDVFAQAPKIVLFTKADNLEYGQAPYGGPTHREMLEAMTPREYQAYGNYGNYGFNLLNPNPGKKK